MHECMCVCVCVRLLNMPVNRYAHAETLDFAPHTEINESYKEIISSRQQPLIYSCDQSVRSSNVHQLLL